MGLADVRDESEEGLLAVRQGPVALGAVRGDEDGVQLAEGWGDQQAEEVPAVAAGRQLVLPTEVEGEHQRPGIAAAASDRDGVAQLGAVGERQGLVADRLHSVWPRGCLLSVDPRRG